jgi:hypothetical protein
LINLVPDNGVVILGVGAVDYLPGSEAPEDGVYEQLNIFGTSTGITERVGKGERLPLAPWGYTWRTAPWMVGQPSEAAG